jgi:steroid 5-alpha reductase family enzyme
LQAEYQENIDKRWGQVKEEQKKWIDQQWFVIIKIFGGIAAFFLLIVIIDTAQPQHQPNSTPGWSVYIMLWTTTKPPRAQQ